MRTTLDDLALKLGVNPSTIDRWLTNDAHPFTKAYRTGRADANAVVQKALLQSAANGNVQAIIFYYRQYLGAVDNPETIVNVTQNNNAPPAVTAEEFRRRFAHAQQLLEKFEAGLQKR